MTLDIGIDVPSGTFTVRVEYYALFKACARKEREDMVLADHDPSRLFDALRERYGFPLHRTLVRLAVNDEFAPWDRPLRSGDIVVFVPPVSGG